MFCAPAVIPVLSRATDIALRRADYFTNPSGQ